jgi:hypothetical protein
LLHPTLYGKAWIWEVRGEGFYAPWPEEAGRGRVFAPVEGAKGGIFGYPQLSARRLALVTNTLSGARLSRVLAALEANWQAEMEGYYTYQALADRAAGESMALRRLEIE